MYGHRHVTFNVHSVSGYSRHQIIENHTVAESFPGRFSAEDQITSREITVLNKKITTECQIFSRGQVITDCCLNLG